jgi:DnaK suppressor protein
MIVFVMDAIVTVLEDKQAQLEAELRSVAAPPDETGGISFGKRVGEGTSMAVTRLEQVSVYEHLEAQLRDVRRARVKLAEDTYGSCDRCGVTIPRERLEALPWACLCVRCAAMR